MSENHDLRRPAIDESQLPTEAGEISSLQEALRESEQRFHSLLEATQEGVALHDGTRIVHANASFARLFGYERIEEVIGKPPLEFIAPEDRAKATRLVHIGTPEPYESSGLRQDGTTFPAEFQGGAITFHGQPARLGVVHDLTAARQAEAEATSALARFISVLENTTDSVHIIDREWRFRYLNERARRSLSQGRELLGQVIWEMFPEAVNTTFWREFHRAMAEQTPSEFEVFYPPQGAWYEVRAYPSVDGLIVFFRDVSERRESLVALRESETRFRTLAATVPEILFTTDSDGLCDYLSPRFHQFTGRAESDMLGAELWTVLHPDDILRVRARWQACLE